MAERERGRERCLGTKPDPFGRVRGSRHSLGMRFVVFFLQLFQIIMSWTVLVASLCYKDKISVSGLSVCVQKAPPFFSFSDVILHEKNALWIHLILLSWGFFFLLFSWPFPCSFDFGGFVWGFFIVFVVLLHLPPFCYATSFRQGLSFGLLIVHYDHCGSSRSLHTQLSPWGSHGLVYLCYRHNLCCQQHLRTWKLSYQNDQTLTWIF